MVGSSRLRWGKYAIAFLCGLIFSNAAGAALAGHYEIALLFLLAVALGAQAIKWGI